MKEKQKKIYMRDIVFFAIMALITISGFVFANYIYGEKSLFNQAISENIVITTAYNKIPAVVKSIQIISIAWLISVCIRGLLKAFLSKSNRGATIVTLLNSFIKYLIVIIEIMLILNAWGVDSGTLFASAGILSLIIGLGAQSLISDIIAGIFIVFEGEYQVGDIVIIDGWRGTVDEIGIRTTKIKDWQGNIKIINNSNISSVINQSKELSFTTCVIAIDYNESIPKVELLIKNNIERMKNAIPEIVEGPYYKGIDSLGDSSVNLLFIAKCKEADYYVVQRGLNRELKLIFDENGISIPFPQITVNQPGTFDHDISSFETERANQFSKEQSSISKKYENTNNH